MGKKYKEKLTLELLKELRPDIEILGEYKNNYTPLEVKCACGNIYYPTPQTLRDGRKCSICAGRKRYTKEELQELRPDITILEIKDNKHIKYKCSCGNISETSQYRLVTKHGNCNKCYGSKVSRSKLSNKEELQKKCPSKEILGEYIDNKTPIKIRCEYGNIHMRRPCDLVYNKPCSCGKESQGERLIRLYLESKNIDYKYNYSFNDCRDKLPLPFDFYLPDYNILIEYDGSQHFKEMPKWENENSNLQKRILHDSIKTNYCKDENIKLIRINYKQINDINNILDKEIQ